jgi:ATP-binding cassette, subfamily B, bacterial
MSLRSSTEQRAKRPSLLPRLLFSRPSTDPEARARARARAVRFLSYYRPHVGLLMAVLGSALLVAGTAIALPLLANHIVSRLPQLQTTPDAIAQILALGAVMLGIFAVQALATYVVDYHGHAMGARIEAQVRQELFDHCQTLSFGYYDRQRTGQLMSRISHDSLWLGELFHHGPEDLAISLLKFSPTSIR